MFKVSLIQLREYEITTLLMHDDQNQAAAPKKAERKSEFVLKLQCIIVKAFLSVILQVV